MAQILNLIKDFSKILSPHLSEISLILVVTLIAVYGGSVLSLLTKKFRRFNIIVRLVVFTSLSFAIFGLTAIYASPLLEAWLRGISKQYMSLVVVFMFLVLGFCADAKHKL